MKFVLDGTGALMVLAGLIWMAFVAMTAFGSSTSGALVLVALAQAGPGAGAVVTGLVLLGLASILDRLDLIKGEAKRAADALEAIKDRSGNR